MKTSDLLFRKAVSAIDSGEIDKLEQLLTENPNLVSERLESPGNWLREKVGNALESFFSKPYLLWFVAEDPVRNNTLPPNIIQITHLIIERAKQFEVNNLQEQLDYALRLVAWSIVAPKCNVQIGLIDLFLNAGASPGGIAEEALINRNFAAAEHLIDRGAKLSLATALCLGRWGDAKELGQTASVAEKQFSLILAALTGKHEAFAILVDFGIDLDKPSADLYSHATALHHAVSSGSLDAVKILVHAGAELNIRDTVYGSTPLGWAEYGKQQEIAAYLRDRGAQE